jgi:hypothetical protein
MNTIRLPCPLFFDSRSFCAVMPAAAWMLPWFAAVCLLAPGNLHADGFGLSRDEHGNTNEPMRVERALSNLFQFSGDEHRSIAEQLREATIQMVNEPAQKEIILYDHCRENMVLQVRYEGPGS